MSQSNNEKLKETGGKKAIKWNKAKLKQNKTKQNKTKQNKIK